MINTVDGIRKLCLRFLDGELEYEEFMDTFVAETWDIEQYGNDEAIEMANKISNGQIFLSEDAITMDEYKQKVRYFIGEEDTREDYEL